MLYMVRLVEKIKQDFEEKKDSDSWKGVKNEAFPIKILDFKIFIFVVYQNHHFCQIFKTSCFIIFLLMSGVCAINSIQ